MQPVLEYNSLTSHAPAFRAGSVGELEVVVASFRFAARVELHDERGGTGTEELLRGVRVVVVVV